MRAVYRNPKELATCLKDLVDLYQENLITYDKLQDKITKIVSANEERFYRNGVISSKISNIIGSERVEIIKEILEEKVS